MDMARVTGAVAPVTAFAGALSLLVHSTAGWWKRDRRTGVMKRHDVSRETSPVPVCILGIAEPWGTLAWPAYYYPAALCPAGRALRRARWDRDRCPGCGMFHHSDGKSPTRTTNYHPDQLTDHGRNTTGC